ncbi:MAG: class D beta-lactamase [Pseudomonadota bacterium]|nr:class D beta-lactamase [Pseudomonadota bacterium]
MKFRIALQLLVLCLPAMASAQEWKERSDWTRFFSEAGITGTIAVVDERTKQHFVYGGERSQTRFIPASTFKVPHALFALDAGIVKDEFQVFPWDGVKRQFPSWNQDQDLRSSLRASTVWVYQSFARQLGERRERKYLRRIGYGNTDTSGGVDRFWLDGGLRISAQEQIVFLKKLYGNRLPFRVEHQRLVKDLMIVEAGHDWILRAKSGWAFDVEPQIGWFVGWVEKPEGPVFFALNIDMPGKANDVAKREAIARAVLRSVHALPPN